MCWLRVLLIALAGPFFLGGCASVPDSTFSYSLPETRVAISVTRTVTCIDPNRIVFNDTVIPTVSQVRGEARSFDTAILNGKLADTQVTVDYHPNGTLKGINAENTGTGTAIIAAAVKFADMFGPSISGAENQGASPQEIAALCQLVSGLKDKTLTLRFEGSAALEHGGVAALRPTANSSVITAEYPRAIPRFCVAVQHSAIPEPPFTTRDGKVPANSIPLREPGLADLEVRAFWPARPGSPHRTCPIGAPPIWEGSVIATQAGIDYGLPAPAPPTFGKTAFSFTLAENGALEKLTYGKTSGVADAIDGATSALEATRGSTTTEETQAINDEIALIKARRQLEQCQEAPDQCE